MLRVECYTVTDGLVVNVLGVDTRHNPNESRLPSAVATTTVSVEALEEYGVERAVCQALAEALDLFPGIVELAML